MKSKHVMQKDDKIYVAGHRGLLGSAIMRRLEKEGFHNIVTRTHDELDLANQQAVEGFFAQEQPDYVIMSAAKVGGIQANREALDQFLYLNTLIEFNTIMSAYRHHVKKFCLVGSGCIYPRECPQPIKESEVLTGPLEITNEGYALAKIAGSKLCEYLNTHHGDRADFISVLPCNLYGPGDSYHPEHSHVIPALLRKFHEAKEEGREEVIMWGTGTAMREFLHIDDLADAIYFLMQNYSGDPGKVSGTPGESWVNIGSGSDLSMKELGRKIADIVGFTGKIVFDHVHPDGTPKKLLDSSKLFSLGWKPSISLDEGLRQTYEDYKTNKDNYRK
ncbi:MAG: GDP-L-fucose synthase [Veillonellaceae bacterium]|nr:GDP-L-fucose synthase [Veillonellaceae bacterium]